MQNKFWNSRLLRANIALSLCSLLIFSNSAFAQEITSPDTNNLTPTKPDTQETTPSTAEVLFRAEIDTQYYGIVNDKSSPEQLSVGVTVHADGKATIDFNGQSFSANYDPKTLTVLHVTSDATFSRTIQLAQTDTGKYQIKSFTALDPHESRGEMLKSKTVYTFEDNFLRTTDTYGEYATGFSSRLRHVRGNFSTQTINGIQTSVVSSIFVTYARPDRNLNLDWPVNPITGKRDSDLDPSHYLVREGKQFYEFDSQGRIQKELSLDISHDNGTFVGYSSVRNFDQNTVMKNSISSFTAPLTDFYNSVQSLDQLNLLANYQSTNPFVSVHNTITDLAGNPLPTLPAGTGAINESTQSTTAVSETSNQLNNLQPVSDPVAPIKTTPSLIGNPSDAADPVTITSRDPKPPVLESIIMPVEPVITEGVIKMPDNLPTRDEGQGKNGPTLEEIIYSLPGGDAPPSPVIPNSPNGPNNDAAPSPGSEPSFVNPIPPTPVPVIKEITKLLETLPIANVDRNAIHADLEQLSGLLIYMPDARNLSSVEFKSYLSYLQATISRLVKLAEKYADNAEVQKAIQNVLLSIFDHTLQSAQIGRADLKSVESDLRLFNMLLDNEAKGPVLSDAETQIIDQNIDATLVMLRQGATSKNTSLVRRSIYKKWYLALAKKARVLRLKRISALAEKNKNEAEVSGQTYPSPGL